MPDQPHTGEPTRADLIERLEGQAELPGFRKGRTAALLREAASALRSPPHTAQPPNNCVTPDGRHVLSLDREDRACIHCGWTASPPHTGGARVETPAEEYERLWGWPASTTGEARVEELRAAYEAGFEESSEGYNGEYVGRKHRGNWPHFLDDGFKEFLSTRAIPASTPEPPEDE